jgi:hypothetical protein
MDFILGLSGVSRTKRVKGILLRGASQCYRGKALQCFSYAGAVPAEREFEAEDSVTHSYALACREVHENPQVRQVRQGTKTKKPRNRLLDLDLPYFMGNFLTYGAEERTRTSTP